MKTRTIMSLLFLGLSIIPLMVVSVFTSVIVNDMVSEDVLNDLQSIATIKENQINSIINQNSELLRLTASRTQLRISLHNYTHYPSPETQNTMNTILLDARNSISSFIEIFLLNSSGIVVSSTNESLILNDYSDNDVFTKGKIENRVDFFYLNSKKELGQYFVGPLSIENEFLGVIVIISKAEDILNISQNYTGLGKTGEVILLKKIDDFNALYITPARFDNLTALNKTIKSDFCSCLFTSEYENTLITNKLDYRNKSVLFVVKYIEKADWALLVKIDKDEIFQNVNFLNFFLIILNFTSIIVIVGVSFVISKYLSNPIIKISEVAGKYSQGDLKYRINLNSTDEIKLLSNTMNEMALNLDNAYKQLEKTMNDLHQSQKMEALGRLAGGVAHDFNNLLTIILGYCELAEEKIDSNNSLYGDLRKIKDASLNAKSITANLLVLSKRHDRNIEAISLKDLILNLSEAFKSTLIPESISLKLDLVEDSCVINGDRSQIEQVLLNLVINSKEAITQNGLINLTLKPIKISSPIQYGMHLTKVGKYIEITVSDNGVGIKKDDLDKIYEPFWTTKNSGTGLGLAIVYSIVEQNKGFIKVISEYGIGTTFSLLFPCVLKENDLKEEYMVKKSERKNLSEKASSRIKNILIVDDDESIRKLVDIILKKKGFSTFIASDVLQAEKIFSENEIDLLISDIVMPLMNGMELAERLLTIKPGLELLFITGYDKYQSSLNYDMIKIKGRILEKPFKVEDLLDLIYKLD